ncbi:hypothetical protein WJX81_006973 [Elliptochloris bilobata]|uniref:Mediator of RNA polymerase II transcription subunit 25 n=1 Tax=Elliptochloris bilobata TaxID=381761 RepID=A0AAW1QM51_9CHLO
MAERTRFCLLLEVTATMAPHWADLRTKYVEPLLRGLERAATDPSGPAAELALVCFGAATPFSACPLDRAGWTSDVALFRRWLDAVAPAGGGRQQTVLTEALAEAVYLLRCPSALGDLAGIRRQCLLVALSEPSRCAIPWPFQEEAKQGVAGFEDLLKAFGKHGGALSVLSWRRHGMQSNQAHRFIAMYAIAQGQEIDRNMVAQCTVSLTPLHQVLISPRWPAALQLLSAERAGAAKPLVPLPAGDAAGRLAASAPALAPSPAAAASPNSAAAWASTPPAAPSPGGSGAGYASAASPGTAGWAGSQDGGGSGGEGPAAARSGAIPSCSGPGPGPGYVQQRTMQPQPGYAGAQPPRHGPPLQPAGAFAAQPAQQGAPQHAAPQGAQAGAPTQPPAQVVWQGRVVLAGALAKSTVDVNLFDARAMVYLPPNGPAPAGVGRDWPQQLVIKKLTEQKLFVTQLKPTQGIIKGRLLIGNIEQTGQRVLEEMAKKQLVALISAGSHDAAGLHVVTGDGIFIALQARNEVHRVAALLGAALVGHLAKFGAHQREAEARLREQRAARSGHNGCGSRLGGLLPWARRRRRGPHHDGGGLFRLGKVCGSAKALMAKGQQLEAQLDVRGAMRCYEDAAKLLPGSSDVLCRCAKSWSDACYLDFVSRERFTDADRRALNQRAMEYAQQAVAVEPHASLPYVALCTATGRLALFSDNRSKAALVKVARQHAVTALELDPRSDLAQHLMGRWHWEMAQLNSVVRFLVRHMYGTELPPGTHADALMHYTRAAELNPRRLAHYVELGRAYKRLGHNARARQELEAALRMDVEDINAHLQKVDAEAMLRDLGPRGASALSNQQFAGQAVSCCGS